MTPLMITREVSARIPTAYGMFDLLVYTNNRDAKEHLVFSVGNHPQPEPTLTRIHSECFTGDVMGSRRCDCGEQLHHAMQMIQASGHGLILYLRQEGRGIGLVDKLKAYNLQDQGYDTVDANLALGHAEDERDYHIAHLILADLGVSQLRLMTNNPSKVRALSTDTLTIVERVPLEPTLLPENTHYLQTKVNRMNHLLTLPDDPNRPRD